MKTGVAKVVGSGGGAVAGALTVLGGGLTLFASALTAGAAAVPMLVAGSALGLASGVTGGAAAVAEKVLKSRQMSEAREAIARDRRATKVLEDRLHRLKEEDLAKQVGDTFATALVFHVSPPGTNWKKIC